MKRVLLVRLSAMGDVVHSLGAVRALAAARPDLELHFATQSAFAPLLEHFDGLASVVCHDRAAALRGLRQTSRELRVLRCDVALDLQSNWKSAAVCWLSGARLRVGAVARQRREPLSRVLLTRGVTAEAPAPARIALAVVRAIAPDAADRAPQLVATDAEIAREADAVTALGIDPARPFRLLVVGDPGDPRSWPSAAIQREAAAPGPPALGLLGPGEAQIKLPAGMPALRHAAGELRRLVALGHLAARAGGRIAGPDKGATHVLAACGAATQVLFGPQDPAFTAPVGAEILVRADGPDCVPCRRRRCHHAEGPVCMDFATAQAVSLGTLADLGSGAPAREL